jgi:opacity protein-like surface antigen
MKKIYIAIMLLLSTIAYAQNDTNSSLNTLKSISKKKNQYDTNSSFDFLEDTSKEENPFFKDLNVHFYLGVAFSGLTLKGDNSEEFNAKGYTLQLGYRYNDYLSIEGRYTKHLGDLEYKAGTTRGANIDDLPNTDFVTRAIYIKPQYGINRVKIYAMLGYGEVRLDNMPELGDRSESGLQWGLGLSYSPLPYMEYYVDFETIYSGKGFGAAGTDVDFTAHSFNIGVAYKFLLKEMK